jgi:hypothetical protein
MYVGTRRAKEWKLDIPSMSADGLQRKREDTCAELAWAGDGAVGRVNEVDLEGGKLESANVGERIGERQRTYVM